MGAVNFSGATLPGPPLTLTARIRLRFVGEYQTFVGWGGSTLEPLGAELRLTPTGNLEYGELASGWHFAAAFQHCLSPMRAGTALLLCAKRLETRDFTSMARLWEVPSCLLTRLVA